MSHSATSSHLTPFLYSCISPSIPPSFSPPSMRFYLPSEKKEEYTPPCCFFGLQQIQSCASLLHPQLSFTLCLSLSLKRCHPSLSLSLSLSLSPCHPFIPLTPHTSSSPITHPPLRRPLSVYSCVSYHPDPVLTVSLSLSSLINEVSVTNLWAFCHCHGYPNSTYTSMCVIWQVRSIFVHILAITCSLVCHHVCECVHVCV